MKLFIVFFLCIWSWDRIGLWFHIIIVEHVASAKWGKRLTWMDCCYLFHLFVFIILFIYLYLFMHFLYVTSACVWLCVCFINQVINIINRQEFSLFLSNALFWIIIDFFFISAKYLKTFLFLISWRNTFYLMVFVISTNQVSNQS